MEVRRRTGGRGEVGAGGEWDCGRDAAVRILHRYEGRVVWKAKFAGWAAAEEVVVILSSAPLC